MSGWDKAKARVLDREDPLRGFRDEFVFPENPTGRTEPSVYLCGNSLGLMPKRASEYVNKELEDWGRLGVEGHLKARHPWLPYHEFLTDATARLVGAKPKEVVVMNTLTVNLHLLMVSFYRPRAKRTKILMEPQAFPSDQYAVQSQMRFHGVDAEKNLLEFKLKDGERTLSTDDMIAQIEKHGSTLALVLLGQVNYLTGQAYDIPRIAEAAQRAGTMLGLDLAHGAGNLEFSLHDWGVDFATWCSYKYLNAGPGALSGVFVHEKHLADPKIPRFEGWWGTEKKTRFEMKPKFDPMSTAEAWQLSNPPILPLATLRASMEVFDRATMKRLRTKSKKLTAFLEEGLQGLPVKVITPSDPEARGAQLSISAPRPVQEPLLELGIYCDFRHPDILRVAPTPLYNSFEDVFRFVEGLKEVLKT